MSRKKKLLIVGQTPPPWGGQAVMIRRLLDTDLGAVEQVFVPMSFSKDMDEIGRFRFRKLLMLPALVGAIWKARFWDGCRTLYYPPGGESFTAIFRDIFILALCRPIFKRVIFHVHSGGFTEVVDTAPWVLKKIAYWAYHRPDVVIHLTEKSPGDGLRIHARRVALAPNGLKDLLGGSHAEEGLQALRDKNKEVTVLFVGVVSQAKGCLDLFQAVALLVRQGHSVRLDVMGRFYSPEFEEVCRELIKKEGIEKNVRFLGVLTGGEKWKAFHRADIFSLPSFFKSENQSLVILEAMQNRLPCVATDWRGMSTMILEGETGFLVPVQSPEKLAEKLGRLVGDPNLRQEMGHRGRDRFLQQFTDEAWSGRMREILEVETL